MSSSDNDDFVNEQWDILRQRVEVLTAAMALHSKVPSGQTLPDLSLHCLRSVDEIELQLFNLYTIPPARISHSEEDMAMWMLEKDSLRREQVAVFLLQSTNLSRMTLHRIASKIVALDSGALFVDGLRYFLLITGLWPCFDERQAADYNEERLRSMLSIYVHTHIQTSKKPIVPLLSQEHTAMIIEIAWLVVQCWKTLQRFEKPLASALTDFSNQLRALIKKPPSTNTSSASSTTSVNITTLDTASNTNTPETFGISNKVISEIFSSISSTPMASLKPASQYPSYLFHEVKKVGKCKVGFNFKDSMTEYHVKLTKDALYLFDHPDLMHEEVVGVSGVHGGKRRELLACIPLQRIQPQRISFTDNEHVVELLDIEGGLASMLHYDAASYKLEEHSYHFAAPKDILFHDRVLLDFSAHSKAVSSQSLSIEQWIDQLEAVAWDCRNGSNSVFSNV